MKKNIYLYCHLKEREKTKSMYNKLYRDIIAALSQTKAKQAYNIVLIYLYSY